LEKKYCVNVVTFSGHGITYKNDAIAIIPEQGLPQDG